MPSERLRDESGAALVEAAFVLPILLLLLFGLTEISLYFWNTNLASKAVQLGVRKAIVSDSVAIGPGLDLGASEGYWDGLPPGQRCFTTGRAESPCPTFRVECDQEHGCRCEGGNCRFTYSEARITPILRAMQAVMPGLSPRNVRIAYETNGLGYVGRPLPVPVDVTVSLLDMAYKPLLLGDVMGPSLPLRAVAKLPGEDLKSR